MMMMAGFGFYVNLSREYYIILLLYVLSRVPRGGAVGRRRVVTHAWYIYFYLPICRILLYIRVCFVCLYIYMLSCSERSLFAPFVVAVILKECHIIVTG